MSTTTLQDMLEQLQIFRQSLPSITGDDSDAREALLAETRKLLLALEREHNVVERVCYQVDINLERMFSNRNLLTFSVR